MPKTSVLQIKLQGYFGPRKKKRGAQVIGLHPAPHVNGLAQLDQEELFLIISLPPGTPSPRINSSSWTPKPTLVPGDELLAERKTCQSKVSSVTASFHVASPIHAYGLGRSSGTRQYRHARSTLPAPRQSTSLPVDGGDPQLFCQSTG
eukprot:scaffold248764_cov43-Prasinocladus_malaysianus.AAC.2